MTNAEVTIGRSPLGAPTRAVVLLTALSLLGACSSTPTTDSSTTSPTASPSTATAPTTTTTTLEAIPTWVRAQVEPRSPDNGYEAMNSVVVFGTRLVAAGTSQRGAEVWLSSDGLRWDRVALQPDLAVPGSEITDLILAGPGLVAAGYVGGENGFGPAIWTSTDGLEWTRVSPDPATFERAGHGGIAALTAGPDRLVAVGYESRWSTAAIWTSVDGALWSPIPHDDDLFGDASGASSRTIDDVVAFEGGFVAVGMAQDGESARASAWLSADGITWSRHDALPNGAVTGYQAMRSVAISNGSLIAVGVDAPGDTPAVWSSNNGVEWALLRRGAHFGGRGTLGTANSEMRAVIATDGGLVAVGSIQESGSYDGAVWISTDGFSWGREESAALGGRWSQGLFAAAEFAGGLAVIGTDSTERGGVMAAAWFIGPSTAVVPTTTTTIAPLPTIVTPPDAPEFLMRCGDRTRPFESPPPLTYPDCAWVTTTDPVWSVARWMLDPANPPDPSESALHILVREGVCANVHTEERGIRTVLMSSGNDAVVFVLLEPAGFGGGCLIGPGVPLTIDLGRPLGELRVFEGFFVPPVLRYPDG